jgi:hypothetical protein
VRRILRFKLVCQEQKNQKSSQVTERNANRVSAECNKIPLQFGILNLRASEKIAAPYGAPFFMPNHFYA